MLKYSFLVPVYNVEKYLEQCIESMLAQIYRNFEIILVDDGSTDNSGRICDDYAKKYPDIIKVIHKQNEGHTATRQVAIKNADSDVCLFVDSDDYVEENTLETVNNELIADPSIDMIIFSFCYSNNGVKTKRKNYIFDKNEVFEGESKKKIYEALMFSSCINSLCTKAIKTKVLQNDTTDYSQIYGMLFAEDQYQSIQLVTDAKKIKCINAELYNYRMDNYSVTRSFDIKILDKKSSLYVYKRYLEILPDWKMDDCKTIERLQAQWLNITSYYFWDFFEKSNSLNDKRQLVYYDWNKFLPACDFGSNGYASKNNILLIKKLEEKNFFVVYIIWLKRKIYGLLKQLKRKIKGK